MKNYLICFLFFSTALMASLHVIDQECELSDDPTELYIDLMKKIVANTIYENTENRETGRDWPSTAHTGLSKIV